MPKTAKQIIGEQGEEIACRYLEDGGFSVIDRNYLRPWGEIDIVAKKLKKLYFIEVKTVSADLSVTRETIGDQYRPEDNVHPQKLERMRKIIQSYLLAHNGDREVEWQFDVVTVRLDDVLKKAKVERIENVIL